MFMSVVRSRVIWSALAAFVATPLVSGTQSVPDWPPATLQDTGLYADWPSRRVAADNLPFSPQYPLWTDGASKSRWMHIPEGAFIDASDPDVWQFPIGTRLWKEFRFGRRAETRFIEHTPAGWQFASYVWNDDESEAPVAPELGIRQAAPIGEGIRHGIPSRSDCRVCHEAGPVRVLGVTVLQLSPDRDPNAPHTEPLPDGAVDLPELVRRGLVRGLRARLAAAPPRIAAATPTARAALGYLSTNCGSCHTSRGDLASLAFALNYTVSTTIDQSPPALLTTVGRPSHFQVPGMPEGAPRVSAGHPEGSVLVRRMESRNPLVQMPPLGTRIVDAVAVALVKRWIAEDLAESPVQRAEAGTAAPK